MNKYFKNNKEVTVERIKAQYEKYRWSSECRDLSIEEKQFNRIVKECSESDIYIDWMKKKKEAKEKAL